MTHSEQERKDSVPKKYDPKKEEREKMAYQRSTTQKKSEKDGVPNKYDPKKWRENQSRKKGLLSTLCTGLINK